MAITGCAKMGPQGPQGEPGIQGLPGPNGQDGVSVVSIIKTSSDGLVDTYTITYSDNTTSTFMVTNGQDGEPGIQGLKGEDGHTPVITIGNNGNWFIDEVDTNIKAQGEKGDKGENGQNGQDGVSVVSIVKTSSTGLVDTYTITYSNNTTSTFMVTNGAQGEQGIQGAKGEDGKSHTIAIGTNGHWYIDGSDTGISAQGKQGKQGKQGEQGKSAYDLYVEQYPGYTWGQTQWVKDLASNKLAFNIEFDTDGGNDIEPLLVFKGEKVTINEVAIKEHATFDAWYFDIERTLPVQHSFIAEQSITLYAGYNYDDSVVTFMSNGEVIDIVNVPHNSKIEQPDNPVAPVGYQFAGWIESGADDFFDFDTLCTKFEYVIEAVFDYEFLEIPAIVINTNDGSDITSKEEYTASTVSVLNTKEEWSMDEVSAGVRGRGNSTWSQDKKPYRIKFDKKQSMLGSSYKAKSWTLIANHSDKTLSRNYLAYELSERFSGLDFSSKHSFVDLYLNNEYKGVYLLCDQIQTGSGRVDIDESISLDGNNGYLIECDGRAPEEGIENQDYFISDGDDKAYAIKTPDTEEEDFLNNKETEIAYIKGYMQECWDAIGSSTNAWSDVEQLIDVDSFAEQYIIDELFANPDSGWTSCYYYKDKDGKLFKGPVWDFDLSLGNFNYGIGNDDECNPNNGLYANKVNSWYKRLLNKVEFVNIVKEKLQSYSDIIDGVAELANTSKDSSLYRLYKNALERNFERWDIMGENVWPEPTSISSIDTLEGHFDYVYNWLNARYAYICEQYSI